MSETMAAKVLFNWKERLEFVHQPCQLLIGAQFCTVLVNKKRSAGHMADCGGLLEMPELNIANPDRVAVARHALSGCSQIHDKTRLSDLSLFDFLKLVAFQT